MPAGSDANSHWGMLVGHADAVTVNCRDECGQATGFGTVDGHAAARRTVPAGAVVSA